MPAADGELSLAGNVFESWAGSGLADVIRFDRSGQITSAHCALLSGIRVGDDVFGKLPILQGCEDIFDDAAGNAYPVSFASVRLVGQDYSGLLDFRIGRSSSADEGFVIVAPAAGHDDLAEKLVQERRQARRLQDQIQ